MPDCPRSGFETILHFSYLWCRNGTFRRSERFVRLPAIRFWNRPAFFVSLQRINPYDMAFFDIFKKKQDTPPTGEQAQKQQEELSAGLEKTKTGLFSKLARAVAGRSTIDAGVLDDLEEVLISSDVGVETTVKIIRRIEERVARDKYMNASELQSILRGEIATLMEDAHGSSENFGLDATEGQPYVVMVVGVNGAGKTTTIGKLAAQLGKAGRKVWIGAADTFRAAAIEQLEVWAERADVPIIKHAEGADPAAVVYDTISAAKARHADVVICDTAGRLHNKKNLMDELSKISRIIDKGLPGCSKEVLLVLDATTGQNAVNQAREFKEAAGLTGIVLTKLDGTAKGGVVLAIHRDLGLPVKFIGVGEQVDDLQPFDAEDFARALFERRPEA